MPEQPEATSEEFSELGDDHPAVKALRAERAKRKDLEQQVKTLQDGSEKAQREADAFIDLKSRFHWLDREYLKGRTVEEWEPWIERLDQLRNANEGTASDESPKETPITPTEQVLSQAQELVSGGAPAEGRLYSASEIQQIGLRDQAEALKLIQQGRMKPS